MKKNIILILMLISVGLTAQRKIFSWNTTKKAYTLDEKWLMNNNILAHDSFLILSVLKDFDGNRLTELHSINIDNQFIEYQTNINANKYILAIAVNGIARQFHGYGAELTLEYKLLKQQYSIKHKYSHRNRRPRKVFHNNTLFDYILVRPEPRTVEPYIGLGLSINSGYNKHQSKSYSSLTDKSGFAFSPHVGIRTYGTIILEFGLNKIFNANYGFVLDEERLIHHYRYKRENIELVAANQKTFLTNRSLHPYLAFGVNSDHLYFKWSVYPIKFVIGPEPYNNLPNIRSHLGFDIAIGYKFNI